MQFISRSKILSYYLPMVLSVVLVVAAIGVYITLKPDTPVAEAAVAYDNSQYNATFNGGTTGPKSYSYTVSGANPILFVALTVDSAQTISGVTYNGVSMTQTDSIAPFANNTNYLFELAGPATGAHNVTVSYTGTPNISALTVSYDGAAQTGQPDNHKTDSQTNDPTTVSLTTNANDSWMVMFSEDANADGLSITAGGTLRVGSGGSNALGLFDSNGAIAPAGSHSMTIEHTFGNVALKSLVASFAPVQSGAYSQVGGKWRQVGGRVVVGKKLSFVQSAHANITSGTGVGAVNATTTAGHTLVVLVAIRNGVTVSSVTDSAGDTFTSQVSNTFASPGDQIQIWTMVRASASTSVTVTLGSATGGDVVVLDYAGVNAIGSTATSTLSSNTNPSISINTQGPNNYVVAGLASQDCSNLTAVSGTVRVNNDFDAFICESAMDNTSSSAGTVTDSGTYAGSSSAAIAAVELKY